MNHFFYTAYNSIPDTFYVLLVLIVIDYITGVCLALKEKTTSSKIGAKGIASKVLIVCMVALSYIVDTSIKGKISVYIFTVTHLFIKCLQAI